MLHKGLESWGSSVHRFRWIIIIGWIFLIVCSGWLSNRYADVLSGGGWDIAGSESQRAKEILTTQFDGRSETSLMLIFQDNETLITDKAYTIKLQQLIDHLNDEEVVESSYSLLNSADSIKPQLIGSDQHTTYALVNLNVDEDYATNLMPDVQERLVAFADEIGVTSYLIGSSAMWGDIAVYSQEGLVIAEMIVLPLIFIILLFVFRSVIATLTPLIVTIAAVAVGMGLIYTVGSQVEMSVFVTNSALMLGLGLGIDYSLFMVNRFRIELSKHQDKIRAIAIAMRTSGHTILFSGITVLAAMTALFVVPIPAIKAIAFGAIAVVIFAVLATLTLLPAVLVMLGERINKLRIPGFSRNRNKPSTFWKKWATNVMKKPVLFLLISLVLLIIFAIPTLDMKLNANDVSILPEESAVRAGFEMYEEAFATGGTATGLLTLSLDEGRLNDESNLEYLKQIHQQLAGLDHVNQVSSVAGFIEGMEPAQASTFLQSDPAGWPPELVPMIHRYISRDGSYAVIEITLATDGASRESQDLVAHIQDVIIPQSDPPSGITFALGGDTMQAIDMNNAIYDSILPALILMLVLIFIILMFTFKSLLLPLKAIIMNLFSVAATFGIVTWVFAEGYGIELFNATANGTISNFIPLLMLALLFGLSTDYEVFLISRVKEHYDETGNNEESLGIGLQETGPLISGAAILMIAVFTGFAFSSMLPIQTLGFGMAVAILIDATIVRLIVVPAAMKLMGKWNWWLPGRNPNKKVQEQLKRT